MALLKKTTLGCLKGTGQRPVISALFVRKVGNVGIGTTGPGSGLVIKGAGTTSATTSEIIKTKAH